MTVLRELDADHVVMPGAEAIRLCRTLWGLELTDATRLATEQDDTFRLGHEYVLKVSNPAQRPEEIDFEWRAMEHAAARGVPVPRLVGGPETITDESGQERVARMMTLLAGTPLDATDATASERERVGETLAALRHALADFEHAAQGRRCAWDITHLPDLAPLLDGRPSVLRAAFDRYMTVVAPHVPGLRRQVLHNDFSKSNLIVDHDSPTFVNEGCRLWDADGHEYLDAYNNVVSVGHGHPRVVAAVEAQMRTLCTHTRYLHDGILRYAEELRATFGGEVGAGHLMLTCTGSEANDLALRIAKYRTGRTGVIVTAEAYHGNSAQTAEISPSLGENSPLGPYVRCVAAPDSYRGQDLARRLADDVRAQIRDLERHGGGLAAFVVDSAFSSDGIYTERDLLAPAVKAVREAGGLFVADEVQCGFGRLGDRLWGFQRHAVDPDIVTLGKPMGNGFPAAGLAVRREVAADFGHDVRYFNTFGGNTVAVAAAQATLDVIRDEGLVAHAARVGAALRRGLSQVQDRHPDRIGDVRGSGLYAGVEIVSDPAAKTPDGPGAAAIVNALRQRRVLISATGPAGNVLKIRPPLVFAEDDAERLTEALDAVL